MKKICGYWQFEDYHKGEFTWCTEQFGEDGLEDGRWWWLDDRIFISNEADAIWFALRWS